MQKNYYQKQKYTKSNRSMISSNSLCCQKNLIDRFCQKAQHHKQTNIVISTIKQVKFPEIHLQKNKETQKQISQNSEQAVQNRKKINKIYKQSKVSHICNFQDKLIFGKIQKSKSQVYNPFMQVISQKRKKQHKFSLMQKKSFKQNSLKKICLNTYALRKNQKECFSVQKKKVFEQIQDIIQKQKRRLKLPSFVRNLKYMHQNKSEIKLHNQNKSDTKLNNQNKSEINLNNQPNEIKIEKQMISITKQRQSRFISKISQRFYRINDTNERTSKQSYNTNQINKNKINKHLSLRQNQLSQVQQNKILQQTDKSSILSFKNWQNKYVRRYKSKPSLRKYQSKAKIKLLQNSLKIKCLQNSDQFSQNDIFQVKFKRANTNKQKMIKLQKVKTVDRSKTDPQKQNNALEQWQKGNWNQQLKPYSMYMVNQPKINKKIIQQNLNKNQKNIKVNLNNSTANIKALLKLRLKQLNQTKSQTWQSK